ncbi:MAG TPA: LPS export ABC transporter periplasmic protein LptC [Chryseolinea sp.]|nr:LPS export ABC transporter periplasmic protein LptC [Chryseolinea sp.]HPH45379.1 LPS export ABC transporter periplasmic protein LptC [Chryseolinea sp.]HPM29349.1 LPS export ABC transporter periplasmic protein LptC [Chryseolinea sp.]
MIVRFIFILLVFAACSPTEVKEPLEYSGPLQEAENVEMFYTESDQIKVKMTAELLYEFQNGDREFPKGVYMEFYNEFGRLESTLRANHAFYFKKDDQWRGRGDVQVKNIEKVEQLNTEELFWKPSKKDIFTEKFVTIRQQGDVIYGTGLTAKQDLSDYTIGTVGDTSGVHGEFDVKEED